MIPAPGISSHLRPWNGAAKRESSEKAQDALRARPPGAGEAASRPGGGRSADSEWSRAISIPFHVLLVVGATGFPPVSRGATGRS